ncbi:hypothetical protein JTB14_001596 [Gonioctena quinquepunctata]|nr:hypothetical protein JTB14_001596 [Gonioctena quinquepunctata]
MESHLFKIWNRTRIEKTLVLVNGTDGALNKLISKDNQYSVIFEKIEILKSVTFMEGFSLMFALYFIFNLEYPSKIGATLEMVQRYHMKIHPASGGKDQENEK